MRIGDLSRRCGVSIRSLRYYEQQRLLSPARLPSGYRVYDERDVTRVRRIQVLLSAGLSTRKIEHILPCLTQHDDGVALTCSDLYDELTAERDDLLARIEVLRASVGALETVISASASTLSAERRGEGDRRAAQSGPTTEGTASPPSRANPARIP